MDPRDVKRKLAAILSADVVGYSRLMGEDEVATLHTLTAHRDVMAALIDQHRGRVVDSPGDNLLAEFASVVDAVRCAVAIQEALKARNMDLPPHRRMEVRIGVNLGDVLVEGDRLYGDGVNIAARMEGLAAGGGICLSGTAHDHVENKLPLQYVDLGEQAVKNIAKPVRAYRVVLDADEASRSSTAALTVHTSRRTKVIAAAVVVLAIAGVTASQMMRSVGTGIKAASDDPLLALPKGPSIAVLPFANLSGDPKQDYFADGIAEEIITQLTRFRELFVIARNSTFRYKGQSVDIKAVGRELGVRYVLEGSVRKAPDRIRVAAQLIDAGSGAHLWAETYDRKLTASNLLGVQDDITEHVVGQIAGSSGVLSRAGLREARSRRTDNLTAYECVLHALDYYDSSGSAQQESHLPARDCLERAIGLDPHYADAWAWLALIYLDEHRFGYNRRPNPEPLDRALNAAQRAVALDAASAMAHYSLASVYFFRHELEQFAAQADQAIALNPNNALALADFGGLFGYMGQLDRSMALTRKAMALNPQHPTWYHATVFNYYYHRRRYEDALAAAQKWNQPEFYWNQVHLAQAYARLGRTKEAQAAVAQLLKLYPDFPKKAREELQMWNVRNDMIEHELDGLRNAGLDIPPE